MAKSGDTKNAPCNGSEKCRKMKFTKWVYGYDSGFLSNTYFWKCLTCGTKRTVS